ncbi:MAG: ricin-type beta-trefoil lectin domain protein [bacterium]|nr:ricin-type beta-trefoil lectin domain protein [bacterium]
MKRDIHKRGFALPTILIASIVMLSVLAVAISTVTAVRSSINDQYYNRLAKEAAESGIAMATYCLENNGYTPQWAGKELHPNTSCSGGAACTSTASCFVMKKDNFRMTYTVEEPINTASVQTLKSIGKVELIRQSNQSIWRTIDFTMKARVGADINFDKVTFGYSDESGGAFFFTVGPDGKARATGANSNGQLGIGSRSASLSPSRVNLPNGELAQSVYTSFLSRGNNSFIITRNGLVYGSGKNNYGQLGNGTKTDSNIMVKFNIPSNQHAKYVAVNGDATYVLTVEGNIYAAGRCTGGMLGTSYTVSGCADVTTPKRVALPTVNTSNQNTIPTSEIVTDRNGTMVRMSGGAVYGWGDNSTGFLGQGNTTSQSKPIKIGDYGDSGKPAATQIGFDGDTLYIVGSDGVLKAAGRNSYGELGHAGPLLNFKGYCMDNKSSGTANGNPIQAWTCNDTVAQDWLITSDGHVKNASSGKCLDDGSSNDANGDLVIQWTCSATNINQKWEVNEYGWIKNIDSGKCLDISDPKTKGNQLMIWSCASVEQQRWYSDDVPDLLPVDMPSGSGNVVAVSTDQWFASILTSTGQVWGVGANVNGALGSNTTNVRQMEPVRYQLPSGVLAKDIYTASLGLSENMSNTFVIGSDNKIYGSGSNTKGQLGIGSTNSYRDVPVAMGVINGSSIKAKDVISGFGTTVVLTTDGKVYTVGNNNSGQLGDGTTSNSSTPKANKYTNVVPVTVF